MQWLEPQSQSMPQQVWEAARGCGRWGRWVSASGVGRGSREWEPGCPLGPRSDPWVSPETRLEPRVVGDGHGRLEDRAGATHHFPDREVPHRDKISDSGSDRRLLKQGDASTLVRRASGLLRAEPLGREAGGSSKHRSPHCTSLSHQLSLPLFSWNSSPLPAPPGPASLPPACVAGAGWGGAPVGQAAPTTSLREVQQPQAWTTGETGPRSHSCRRGKGSERPRLQSAPVDPTQTQVTKGGPQL